MLLPAASRSGLVGEGADESVERLPKARITPVKMAAATYLKKGSFFMFCGWLKAETGTRRLGFEIGHNIAASISARDVTRACPKTSRPPRAGTFP